MRWVLVFNGYHITKGQAELIKGHISIGIHIERIENRFQLIRLQLHFISHALNKENRSGWKLMTNTGRRFIYLHITPGYETFLLLVTNSEESTSSSPDGFTGIHHVVLCLRWSPNWELHPHGWRWHTGVLLSSFPTGRQSWASFKLHLCKSLEKWLIIYWVQNW